MDICIFRTSSSLVVFFFSFGSTRLCFFIVRRTCCVPHGPSIFPYHPPSCEPRTDYWISRFLRFIQPYHAFSRIYPALTFIITIVHCRFV
ncbi:hypothetical protein BYT27DRAFT_6753171 [Phlegmacium glaucopus]|nr:hypothetical protein BYT27DRAFT_6753171 [Phlegmacium glaucopus]